MSEEVEEPKLRQRLLSLEQIASTFGVNRRTIDSWVALGCPATKSGRAWQMDPAEVYKWRFEKERRDILGELANLDAKAAKDRKLIAEAALAEFDLAAKTGEAVSLDDFQKAMAELIGTARSRLRGIGSTAGPRVAIETDPVVCQAIIDDEVREALLELSESRYVSDDPEGDGESTADEESSLEAVGSPT